MPACSNFGLCALLKGALLYMSTKGVVTLLGTGTSQGIPMIGCGCQVCTSMDWRDQRLRSSMHLQVGNTSLVIDSGPDFRQQMLRQRIPTLDAILFTHEHKDHIAGLDDVRGYNYKQQRAMPLYGQQRVLDRLQVEFAYAFGDKKYPGVPDLELVPVTEPFEVKGVPVIPFTVMHFRLPVLGYRFGDFAYITDAKTVAPEELAKIKGVKTLVVNGLQEAEHNSHFTLAEALDFIELVGAERTYLTHISHRLGLHAEVERTKLPAHVRLGYDGLKFEVEV